MTDNQTPDGKAADDHVTHPTNPKRHERNGHVMRKVVRSMVANMETVLKDIHGIMGDIKTLVVQIDSVTDKIDAQCSSKGKENHVIRKPEMIDCQTYWSRTLSQKCQKERKDTAAKPEVNGSSQGYETPVFPLSLCSSQKPPNERLDNTHKLSNVERWLMHENARHYERFVQHSKTRTGSRKVKKSVKFNEWQRDPKRKPLNGTDTTYTDSTYSPHIVRQPCAQVGDFQRGQRSLVDESSQIKRTLHVEPEYSNRKYEEITNDGPSSKCMITKSKTSSLYVLPEQTTQKRCEDGDGKQIRVYNSHYEENTDDSPIDSETNRPVSTVKPNNEFSVVVPQFQHSKAQNTETAITKTEQCPALPHSPRISKRSNMIPPNTSQVYRKTYRPLSRLSHSIDSESHRYQSLESDLDSLNDCNDPRCMTPDMDWSYLGLMGNGTNKIRDKSSNHVYQTIGSPVFQRRKAKMLYNITKSMSFQTSQEVVSKLICVENANFATLTPDTDTPGDKTCFNSSDSSVLSGLEELNGSTIINHVFCNEVTESKCGEYCGHYEAVVDAVLENVSGYSSLEEACIALENGIEIVEESYIGFDDDFFDDEWDVGLKPSSDFYFEDDIDYSLSVIPQMENGLRLSTSTSPSQLLDSPKHVVQMTSSQMVLPSFASKGNQRLLSPRYEMNDLLSDCDGRIKITYDHVDIKDNTPHRLTGNHVSLQIVKVKTDHLPQLTFWDQPKVQALVHMCDNSSTSSDDGSGEPMTSGSSNMSFGSVDLDSTNPECEDRSSLSYNADHTPNETCPQDGHPAQPVISQGPEGIDANTGATELVGSALEQVGCLSENSSITARRDSTPNLRTSSLATNNDLDASCGASVDDPIAYNRNVNTWTAFAMVHVPADEISDSASDIINDNSVNTSLTSSYFEADNNAVAQINQGFVDTK